MSCGLVYVIGDVNVLTFHHRLRLFNKGCKYFMYCLAYVLFWNVSFNAEVFPVPCNGREIQEIIQEMLEADAME